jgi:hypothetical protein
MIRFLRGFIFFTACMIIFIRCAQVTPLTGGARDTMPPKLISSTPESKSVSFAGSEIILQFDEYVQVRDIQNQIVITPTLKNMPEMESAGKKIRIQFKKEDLLPNTTYRIAFGRSIADMHEGNVLENAEYIFSTGTILDTLSITGNVSNALNANSEANITVGLFLGNEKDSAVYKQTPLYISKTDANGNYSIKNIAATTFKLIGFNDKNKNGTYDGSEEQIGFYDESLNLNSDTSINLKLFQEEPSRLFLKKTISQEYGSSLLVYSKSLSSTNIKPSALKAKDVYITNVENDSIAVFYKNCTDSLWLFQKNETKLDTIKLNLPKVKWEGKKKLNIKTNLINAILILETNKWLDSSSFQLKQSQLINLNDSTKEPLRLMMLASNKLVVVNKLKPGMSYKLKIDTAALVDYEKNYNDSLVITFKQQLATELGKLALKVTFTTKNNHLIQLLNENKQVIKERSIKPALAETNVKTIDFTDVPAGQYLIRVVFDENENEKWDTGNFMKHKQAERIKLLDKRVKVMSDWEVEEEIFIKE